MFAATPLQGTAPSSHNNTARRVDAIRAQTRSGSFVGHQKRVYKNSFGITPVPITKYFTTNPEMVFNRLVVEGDPQLAPILQEMPLLQYELLHHDVRPSDILQQTNALETFFYTEGLTDVHILVDVGGPKGDRTLFLTVERGQVTALRDMHHYGYQTNTLRYYAYKMGQSPDFAQRYYYYVLANQLQGITVDTYLEPTRNHGVYDYYTLGHRQRFGGFLSMTNIGIQPTGHMIYSGNAYLNDIFGNDQLEAGGSFTSKTNKGQFFFSTYRINLGHHGTQLLADFAYNKLQLGETIFYDFFGRGKSFTLEIMQPFYITPKTFLRMIMGYAIERGKNRGYAYDPPTVIALDFQSSVVKETLPTVYAEFAFSHLYSMGRVWGDIGATAWGHFLIRPQYKAVGGLEQLDTLDPTIRIPLSRAPKMEGAKVTFDYNQVVILPRDFSVYLGSQGQFGFDGQLPLGMLFQFYQGAFLGQGYVGDSGVSGRGEVRWDWNIFNTYFRDIQFFTYYALAYINTNDPLYTSYSRVVPMTAGFGLRTHFLRKMQGFIEFAKPIRRKTTYDNKAAWRFFFGLAVNT